MATITINNKIEAIQRALSSPKSLQTCLEEILAKSSDTPSGKVKISQDDVPNVSDNHIRMMLSLMKPLDNVIEIGIKRDKTESKDGKKTNKDIISNVKKLTKKIKPMIQTPAKLNQNVEALKKELDIK